MDDGYQDGSGDDTSGHKCNGTLRGFKGGLYEGGTRVPFLARWPGKVPAGATSGQLICHVDLLATVAALVGKELPAEAGPDSLNLLPALLSERPETPCRDSLIVHGGSGRLAVRKGPWKLIPGPGPGPGQGAGKGAPRGPELYHLDDDLGETNNLAESNPARVEELARLLRQVREGGPGRPTKK